MSNLVPVRRMDKNGVMTTKYVRPDKGSSGASQLPAPSAGTGKKKQYADPALERRRRALDRSSVRTFSRKKTGIHANTILEKYYKDNYSFRCSDNEFYAVLEKLDIDDAIVLMTAGLRPQQIDSFVEKQYMHYAVDNSLLVSELRTRAIPLYEYLHISKNIFTGHYAQSAVLDAAEARALFPGKDNETTRQWYSEQVAGGLISLDDMKVIGLDRCKRNMGDFIQLLPKIKSGESKATAEEIGLMIDRLEENPDVIHGDTEHKVLISVWARFAVRFGTDFVESINHPLSLYYSEEDSTEMDDETAKEFLAYSDQASMTTLGPMTSYSDDKKWIVEAGNKRRLWDAGIDADVAREGLDGGMSAEQIIAVQQHGISTGVSSGWL